MAKHELRVGVIGAGRVLRHSWPALCRAGHRLVMLSSRNVHRAEALLRSILESETNSCETDDRNSSGSNISSRSRSVHTQRWPSIRSRYQDVITSADVDVVYITLPTGLRHDWVIAALAHGKHVVGEKPAASNAAQLHQWLYTAAQNRLLYMDGTALSHSLRVHAVRRVLQTLGPVQHMTVHMSSALTRDGFSDEMDIRLRTELEPLGALGDLGWYCVRWILHVMDFAVPSHVSARVTHCATVPVLSSSSSSAACVTAGDGGSNRHSTAGPLSDATGATRPIPNEMATSRDEAASKRGAAILGFEGHLQFSTHSSNDNTHSNNSSSSINKSADAATLHDPQRTVNATFYCSFTEARQQTVRVFAQQGVLIVDAAINPLSSSMPCFTVERYAWNSPGHAPMMRKSCEGNCDEDVADSRVIDKDVYATQSVARCSPGLMQTLRRETVTCPAELDGRYQRDQLWRDVGEALMALMPGKPLVAHAEQALVWSSYAYKTQVVMDQLLAAARANAISSTAEQKKEGAVV